MLQSTRTFEYIVYRTCTNVRVLLAAVQYIRQVGVLLAAVQYLRYVRVLLAAVQYIRQVGVLLAAVQYLRYIGVLLAAVQYLRYVGVLPAAVQYLRYVGVLLATVQYLRYVGVLLAAVQYLRYVGVLVSRVLCPLDVLLVYQHLDALLDDGDRRGEPGLQQIRVNTRQTVFTAEFIWIRNLKFFVPFTIRTITLNIQNYLK